MLSLFHGEGLPTIVAIIYMERFDMALSHSLGFPRIGADRELKKALEAHWKGELDEAGLRAVGRQLRATHWQVQKDAGIELLPVGDFAWYDQVLAHSLAFGVIPERFREAGALPTLPSRTFNAARAAWIFVLAAPVTFS